MSDAAAAAAVAASTLDSTHRASFVKQWFCGDIEASYYGVPSRVPAASSDSVGRRFRLHIYRAAMLRAEAIDAPVEAAEAASRSEEVFVQQTVEIAHLWGVRGPGTRYEGPIHDVSIERPQTSFHVVKDGKSYGTLRGRARGWVYLPQAVTPEPPPPVAQENEIHRADLPMGVVIQESPPENGAVPPAQDQRAPATIARDDSTFVAASVPDASLDDVDAKPRRMPASQKAEPPYFSLAAAVGLLLWFTCDVEQTWIWCLFMLPTLGMRRLVHEVLPEERGVLAFAAVLILGAALGAGTILAGFGAQQCWKLETAPLVILVACVFLSGIVPYRLPLGITALAFAAVLFVWGHEPQRHCPSDVPVESLPTIRDPGTPRTNDDGTWPRRVPADPSQ